MARSLERPTAERGRAPFLVYRDAEGAEATVDLPSSGERFTIGRRPGNALSLGWDAKVSRVHAAIERVGQDWVLIDGGLSYNGTYLNAQRLLSRRRLADGDVIGVGSGGRQPSIVRISPAGAVTDILIAPPADVTAGT